MKNNTTSSPPPSSSAAAKLSPLILALVALAAAVGVGERLWLTSLAPRWAYTWDHFDNIQMGRAASQAGLFHAYSLTPANGPSGAGRVPAVTGYLWSDANDAFVLETRSAVRPVNYPPLGLTLFWVQSSLLESLQPGLPVNTFTSRLLMSLASILAELATSVAVFLLVRRLCRPAIALGAAALCWILPPLAMDSCFWGQTDAWFIAPTLFILLLMIRGRWVGAGILSAATVLLKPQGIFLAPIVLFAAAILPEGPTAPQMPVLLRRLLRAAGAGAAALLVLSTPWTIADGRNWLDRAYIDNFTIQAYEETTLKAFNVWYLDALVHDDDIQPVLDPKGDVLGLAKDTWGRLLAVASLLALGWLHFRKRLPKAELALLLFSGVWLWSTFLWPTRVHERYVLYAVPLVVISSFALKRLWPAALILVLVASAELCHNVWLKMPPGYLVHPRQVNRVYEAMIAYGREHGGPYPSKQDALRYVQDQARQQQAQYLKERDKTRAAEYLLTLGCLLAYGWAFACPFLKMGKEDAEERPAQSRQQPPPRRE
jgi:hypothetical protein